MRSTIFIFSMLVCIHGLAQQDTVEYYPQPVVQQQMPVSMDTITVHAYGYGISLQAPAAVYTVSPRELERFSNTGLLPAINNIPGVRMEERSPGSYRLGIRGSAFNTPFGVRNVKVYYNGIPYTDAGGNTYLNQLGYYNFNTVEVGREPGSSMYGAGTGGAVFINSEDNTTWQRGVGLHYTAGSYGLSSMAAEWREGTTGFQNTIRYQHLDYAGYRNHSAMHRYVFSWDSWISAGARGGLQATFLYSDLYYQTPGGLTEQQYDTNARMARPPSGTIAGAAQNKAAVNQDAVLAGLTYTYIISCRWINTTAIYGRFTLMDNPTIRNYSKLAQPGYGGRSIFTWSLKKREQLWQLSAGAEVQKGFSLESTFQNISGATGNIQQQATIENANLTCFTQLKWSYRRFIATAGASLSSLDVRLNSNFPAPMTITKRKFNNQVAPRVALLYMAAKHLSLLASFSRGFSPPTTEELSPTGGIFNRTLQPSSGWNFQAGIRSRQADGRVFFDVVGFYYALSNLVVQRRDSAGGDFYINAGSAGQTGVEAMVKYMIKRPSQDWISSMDVFASYTGYHFRYRGFQQGASDYSGNRVPGVAPAVLAAGCNMRTRHHYYLNVNGWYSDIVPLDDANTVSATSSLVADIKAGKEMKYKRHLLNIYAGVNNLFNQKYSLGNDINAAGGRYYNAAAPINYYAGLSLKLGY